MKNGCRKFVLLSVSLIVLSALVAYGIQVLLGPAAVLGMVPVVCVVLILVGNGLGWEDK